MLEGHFQRSIVGKGRRRLIRRRAAHRERWQRSRTWTRADVVAVVGVACHGLGVALSPCWVLVLLWSKSGVWSKFDYLPVLNDRAKK